MSRIVRGYVPDTAALMQKRYGFVRAPKTAEEILAGYGPPTERQEGLTFAHGKMIHRDREIVIDRLIFYPQLVVVDTPTGTDDGDLVLDDLLSQDPEIKTFADRQRAYVSQLEVELKQPLDVIFFASLSFGADLADFLKGYTEWPTPPPAPRTFSFTMGWDIPVPCNFRVERRVGKSTDANVYFSEAPLRSDDHAFALENFEQRLTDKVTEDALRVARLLDQD